MYPYIVISESIRIPTYGVMFFIGYAGAVCIAMRSALFYRVNKWDVIYSAVYMILGIGVGAKLMYFVSKVPRIFLHFDAFVKLWRLDIMSALNYLFGGLTFYGGLIGAATGLIVYCRIYQVDIGGLSKLMIPYIPFVHMFGRIGCFFAGCCYGIPYKGPLAVHFPYNEIEPKLSEVSRFPVQLLEAGGNLVLFIILFVYRRKGRPSGKTLFGLYLLLYGVMRFFIELLRDDLDRGQYKLFSTSQIISVIVVAVGLYFIVTSKRERSKKICNNE
ncbi:MAG: prolipoprotein diacylglyceryl transferase [Lachnospiraceae bacterium]|nr:prolipoprotein diacylglyceryl transferase [Lachnospiraceae bacterium]